MFLSNELMRRGHIHIPEPWGDADNDEIRLGEFARDAQVVDLCEGSMDNEERQFEEEVGFVGRV